MEFRFPPKVIMAGEWLVLMPLWRKWIRTRDVRIAAAMTTGAAWLVIVAVLGSALNGEDSPDTVGRAAARGSATATPERAAPTRTPTASPSPDAIASPTPEPAAAPTSSGGPGPGATPGSGATTAPPPAPAAAVVIVSSSMYADSDSALHVAGEVRNGTADYLDYVEITGTFFDASGQVVASEFTFTHVDLVAPGDIAGFDIGLANGAGLGVSRYELAVRGEVSPDRPASGLVVTGDSASVDEAGDYHVVGLVTNQSGAPAEFVTVAGTFYAADGTVVRSDFTYADAEVVQPGESVAFDLTVPEGGAAPIATYQLRVEGFPV